MPTDEIEVDANGEILVSSITGYSVAKTLAGQVFFRVQYLNPDLRTMSATQLILEPKDAAELGRMLQLYAEPFVQSPHGTIQ
ncbi:hypothetical protein [Granulicella tundricola]|uniref:Uncharacterized protein n=1 Tax=Granulicella tundricola (strain ATCC BAA-1859 / DSM 23138 / MP5ACTX9) TaxID=1198114 RepID=E8X7P3_GRATM|nr:hypothetical protein [Granulicella tundricola]ADW71477.1 hypothetical protein AciX9_4540 [Granulicella tundricola MP5ACTX9]